MKEECTKTLQEQAIEARREYMREYRKKNADKVREWNRTYWERKAQRASEKATQT